MADTEITFFGEKGGGSSVKKQGYEPEHHRDGKGEYRSWCELDDLAVAKMGRDMQGRGPIIVAGPEESFLSCARH